MDEETGGDGLRERLTRQGEDALGRLAQDLLENPLVNGAIARAFEANLLQVGLAPLGIPALTVTTGLVGHTPVGVQLVAARYREDLCLAAGAAIEAGGVPDMPVDPA